MDVPFLLVAVALLVLGLLMLASAGGPTGYAQFGDTYYFLKHQLIFGFLPGLAIMIVLSRLPYQWWRTWAWELLLVSIVLLVLVFIPGLRAEFGTSQSWIQFGGLFSLQPAEIVKLTFLFYLAAWLERRDTSNVQDLSSGLLPFATVLGIILFLMALQPDVGTMVILAAMALAVFFAAGARLSHVGILACAGAFIVGILVLVAPYRLARFVAFLDPLRDPLGIGYHVNQALLAIGTGGWIGRGFGHSIQKFQYLPEVVGDSIFAVIAEELGFLFTVPLILLFVALFLRGLRIAAGAPDRFGRYVVVGIVSWLVLQAFVNIGAMMSLLPITGVTLPLVSYGGTSLAITMGAIGVVLNVSRYARR
ncbi:putative lipid II flippase FtsW [Candidatus Uhrbacteria bacterium]|nr:putative lipid II flippase FtsW [Candidatus Uhrbacteria bacterium]